MTQVHFGGVHDRCDRDVNSLLCNYSSMEISLIVGARVPQVARVTRRRQARVRAPTMGAYEPRPLPRDTDEYFGSEVPCIAHSVGQDTNESPCLSSVSHDTVGYRLQMHNMAPSTAYRWRWMR